MRYATDRPTGLKSNQRLASQRVVYLDDGYTPPGTETGCVHADVNLSKFDGLGHFRQVDTAGTFDDRSVSEGGQTLKTQYCWQKTPPPASITGPTGFHTRVRTLQAGTPGGYDRLAVYTPTAQGDVATEQYYSGDTQFIATTAAVCDVTPPSSDKYRIGNVWQYGLLKTSSLLTSAGGSIGFQPVDRDLDSSGLVTAERDVADLLTSFEYDNLGRVTWAKPSSGHEAWTEYVYARATSPSALANLTLRQRTNNGTKTGAILAEDKVLFDAFGRLRQEQHLMPSGSWSTRERTYNANGWPASISEWGSTTKTTTFTGYDPFGRPTTVTPPDGTNHKLTLTYFGDREVSRQAKAWTTPTQETSVFTTEVYDRQGRLYQFIEASGLSWLLRPLHRSGARTRQRCDRLVAVSRRLHSQQWDGRAAAGPRPPCCGSVAAARSARRSRLRVHEQQRQHCFRRRRTCRRMVCLSNLRCLYSDNRPV